MMAALPRPHRLRQLLEEGRAAFGVFCSTPAPEMVELVGCAGFDFVVLDTEHALVGPETLAHLLRAADAVGLDALVRVADVERGPILAALDFGAAGVLVANVESEAEVAAAVRASRYHPEGRRGLNAGRSTGYGSRDLAAQLQRANQEVVVAAMIESRRGTEALDEIISVPGLDLVMEGAADLSQSLGLPWQTRHPRVHELLGQVQAACARHHLPFCAIPRRLEDFDAWWDEGVRTFVVGDQRGIALRALQSHLAGFKERRP